MAKLDLCFFFKSWIHVASSQNSGCGEWIYKEFCYCSIIVKFNYLSVCLNIIKPKWAQNATKVGREAVLTCWNSGGGDICLILLFYMHRKNPPGPNS